MNYKLSKKVEQGTIVALRGDKFIRCGRSLHPFGVWENGHNRITVTLDGERISTPQPTGVVTYGTMDVQVKL